MRHGLKKPQTLIQVVNSCTYLGNNRLYSLSNSVSPFPINVNACHDCLQLGKWLPIKAVVICPASVASIEMLTGALSPIRKKGVANILTFCTYSDFFEEQNQRKCCNIKGWQLNQHCKKCKWIAEQSNLNFKYMLRGGGSKLAETERKRNLGVIEDSWVVMLTWCTTVGENKPTLFWD